MCEQSKITKKKKRTSTFKLKIKRENLFLQETCLTPRNAKISSLNVMYLIKVDLCWKFQIDAITSSPGVFRNLSPLFSSPVIKNVLPFSKFDIPNGLYLTSFKLFFKWSIHYFIWIQVIENFSWNIKILCGQADLLKTTKQRCDESLKQVYYFFWIWYKTQILWFFIF